jgi:hypothetical protein
MWSLKARLYSLAPTLPRLTRCVQTVPGYLKGYVRRFAQSSHDHRGTPEVRARPARTAALRPAHSDPPPQNPGRVVTLVHKEDWARFSASVRTSCSLGPLIRALLMHVVIAGPLPGRRRRMGCASSSLTS